MLAGFVQSALEAIVDIDPALGRKVRSHLKYETLAAIESASPIALIAVDHDVELNDCFFALAGRANACAALRENLRRSFDQPLWRPFLDGARGIFGASLMRALGLAPRIWGLVYRDAGEMTVAECTVGRIRFDLCGIPLAIAASPNYLAGTAATLAGFFDVARVDGRVELIGPDLRNGCASLVLSW
jgi:hypothetical protein